jgi:methionyl-tRNA formyltransferase
LIRPDLVVEVPHVNHSKVSALVDRLKPDIIAVFGTGLIRGPLLAGGRLGIINLHGGLSPHYRGSDCTFWALYNGEPDQVGCTLHFIDPGIDTGNLIAHICPEVSEGDDESTLFWRGVRDSAEIYAECLERLGRGEKLGQKQNEKGRLYLFKHRTLRHERAVQRKLRNGLLRSATSCTSPLVSRHLAASRGCSFQTKGSRTSLIGRGLQVVGDRAEDAAADALPGHL